VISIAPGTKVYLACRPVSMRYGFDGLAAQVKQVLDADPFAGHDVPDSRRAPHVDRRKAARHGEAVGR